MSKKDDEQIVQKFRTAKARQLAAIALTVLLIITLAVISKRPDLFGVFSRKTVLITLLAVMLLFVNFSSWNWRCPSCRNYLGNDLLQENCRKCGVKLR